jgi:hypothetical protein
MAKEILLVMLEFDNWEQGRSWSYTGSYAFLDGLRSNGHHCTVLPAIHGRSPDSADSFIHHAPDLFAGKTFDEAWIWCNHATFDEKFWSWLKRVAPVRVGVVLESLHYTQEELLALPFLAEREKDAYASLRHCTHALAADEADVTEITETLGIPATWNVFMVPEQFIRSDPPPTSDIAAFIGAGYFTGPAYNFPLAHTLPRNQYLNSPELSLLMNRPHFQLPERSSDVLPRFESLHQKMKARLLAGALDANSLEHFVSELQELREQIFTMFLEGLRIGMACVNLPTLVKSFSGRVIEAMAAGVPSVSWLPPNRGSCEKLFSDGKDLLLFNTIEELIDKLMLLRQQPQLKTTLVNSARNILLERHTSKIRCAQYAAWLDNASSPTF